MARKKEGPWYRSATGSWYVTLDGKQQPLGKHPDGLPEPTKRKGRWWPPPVIEEAYHRLMAGGVPETPPSREPEGLAVVAVLDAFLEWVQIHKAERTYDSYLERLQSFVSYLRKQSLLELKVDDLRPFHVREWADSHKNWKPGMKRGRIMAVQRAFNWAVREGKIDRSPIRYMEKPQQGKREVVVAPEEFAGMLKAVRVEEFRDLLTVAWECGCRPQEIVRVEARHVDLDGNRWVFPEKESKGKKRIRIVYLTPKALEITRRLMERYPTGKLFRNSKGRPWTAFAIDCGFKRLARKLGKKVALVDFRHSFITRAIKKGVDPVTLANLVGHVDTAMISRVYAHLSQDSDHLKKALGKANQAEDV